MEEAEMIFASDNLICCSPRHSTGNTRFSENKLSSPQDKLSTVQNLKFLDIYKTPSEEFLIDDSIKSFSIEGSSKLLETNEKFCEDEAFEQTNACKR